MLIHRDTNNLDISGGTTITIGTFDGVHLGHRKLLNRLREASLENGTESLVFTFSPHPRHVLFPDQKDLRLLSTNEERAVLIREQGITHLLEYPFTKEFSQIDPKEYVEKILMDQLSMKKIIIGYDHRFGRNRSGSIVLIKELSTELGFDVEEISAQEVDSINISSTRIRQYLLEGKIESARSLLGYDYFFSGTVAEGKKLGRQIGFPTANLSEIDTHKLIPANGVYAVIAELNGIKRKAMMNIGVNPTTDQDNQLKIEINIFDFGEDIYGKQLTIQVKDFIRKEMKFGGLEELKLALGSDKSRTMEILSAIAL